MMSRAQLFFFLSFSSPNSILKGKKKVGGGGAKHFFSLSFFILFFYTSSLHKAPPPCVCVCHPVFPICRRYIYNKLYVTCRRSLESEGSEKRRREKLGGPPPIRITNCRRRGAITNRSCRSLYSPQSLTRYEKNKNKKGEIKFLFLFLFSGPRRRSSC